MNGGRTSPKNIASWQDSAWRFWKPLRTHLESWLGIRMNFSHLERFRLENTSLSFIENCRMTVLL